jgi:Fur family transcriptional regulator, ferric uptake regulator
MVPGGAGTGANTLAAMEVHAEVGTRLAATGQRYTTGRRALVEVLEASGRPLTVPELTQGAGAWGLSQSSTYRNLTVLVDSGVVRRVQGAAGHDRFELAEGLAGHHHHLLCTSCGVVADVAATPRLERAVAEAARAASEASGFQVMGHQVDLVGLCGQCRP